MNFIYFVLKTVVRCIVLVLILVGVVLLFQEQLLNRVLEVPLRASLAVDVSIDRAQFDLGSRVLRVEGARIGNPPGFVRKDALDVESVEMYFSGWVEGALEVELLKARLNGFEVERRVGGQFNVLSHQPKYAFLEKWLRIQRSEVRVQKLIFSDLMGPVFKRKVLENERGEVFELFEHVGLAELIYALGEKALSLWSDDPQSHEDAIASTGEEPVTYSFFSNKKPDAL